eukprot:scaffold14.g1276.t1
MAQLLSCSALRAAPFTSSSTQQQRQRVVAKAKPGLHPEWHEEAKVMCNGEEVLVTSGTQPSYTVDIWSGNHPFFQGITSMVVTDEGRVNRFKRRFAGLDSISTVAVRACSGMISVVADKRLLLTLSGGKISEEELKGFKQQSKGGKGKGGKRK